MKPSRIFMPSMGTAEWRAKLADPYLHWRRKKSAWEMAVAWEARRANESGLPPEIEETLNAHPVFAQARLLMAVPEHRVRLDDDRRPSQNDLWAILLLKQGYASTTIEAKAGEEFDKTISEWMAKESEGKSDRLRFLADTLGLRKTPPGHIRYQLVHRTASAVLEAKRWRATVALMIVQCFKESAASWNDYCAFVDLFGVTPERGAVSGPKTIENIGLFFSWIDSPMADDATAANAI